MKITVEIAMAANEMFFRLCCLCRWSSVSAEGKYNELTKQALNCISAYLLASVLEEDGYTIRWELFPKIAIYRAFEKAYVNFDVPDQMIDEICKCGAIDPQEVRKIPKEIITQKCWKEFAEFICEGKGSLEEEIYKVATKLATHVELEEIKKSIPRDAYIMNLKQIKSFGRQHCKRCSTKKFSRRGSIYFKTIRKVSNLRNQVRWAGHAYSVECSVLGHLFDTAVIAYLMSLEENPEDEQLATTRFFMGIFHDVAEAWTKDIPSPIKDRVLGLREATEKYEEICLEKNFYKGLPTYIKKKLKEVEFENTNNAKMKKFMKGADYLSADCECWRQYKAGTRDEYFKEAIKNRSDRIQNGENYVTPVFLELHKFIAGYIKRLDL